MTNTSEVVVSDEEANQVIATFYVLRKVDGLAAMRQALAAFLARRVPDAKTGPFLDDAISYERGFNACRDRVLSGS